MEYKYETHMHTKESSMCAKSTAVEQVRAYKDRGYTGIIVTDHIKSFNFMRGSLFQLKPLLSWKNKVEFLKKGYEKAKAEGEKIGLDVFFGWEFDYRGSDFLTYGLDIDFLLNNKKIEKMSIQEYSKLVRDYGGYIAQAHPYRKQVVGDRSDPVDANLLDGVEIFNVKNNTKHSSNLNDMAKDFALRHDLPAQAGTDSHKAYAQYSAIGKEHSYSGIIMTKKAESINDIIDEIKSRNIQLILPEKGNMCIDDEDSMFVSILYDSKRAKDAAEYLCEYINDKLEKECTYAHIDEADKIAQNVARINKTIILGRHIDAKKRLIDLNELKYHKYGMRYGFDDNLCVLTVSRSELRDSKDDWDKFIVDYCIKFKDNPLNEQTRTAQFNFVTNEFIEHGLLEFLSSNNSYPTN